MRQLFLYPPKHIRKYHEAADVHVTAEAQVSQSVACRDSPTTIGKLAWKHVSGQGGASSDSILYLMRSDLVLLATGESVCVNDRRRPPHKYTVPCVLPPHAGWLAVSQQARYHDLLVSLDRLTADERRVMAKAAEGTVGFRSRFKGREAQEQYRSVRRQGAIYRGVSEGGMLLVSNFTPDIRLCL